MNKNKFVNYTFRNHNGVSYENIPLKKIQEEVKKVPLFKGQIVYSHCYLEEKIVTGDKKQIEYLGYKDEIFNIENLIGLVHPKDLNTVYQITRKAFDTIYSCRYKLDSFKYNITYRIKNNKNEYIRILRETTPLLTDRTGKLICTVSRCTDISQLGHHNEIKAWINLPDKIIDLTNELNNKLSKREKEILFYLANGYSSKKISQKLFISKLTVDKHRANMLKKTSTKNTTDLIRFAIEKGLIIF